MLDRTAHPNTRVMLEAWRRMEQSPLDSFASAVAECDATPLVRNIFVLREVAPDRWPFRTAGESIVRLFGKEVCDENFLDLWMGADRTMIQSSIFAVLSENAPALIRARGETLTGRQLQVEIALAPLSRQSAGPRRILGHYQPLGGEALVGDRPIWRHAITEVRAPQRIVRRPHLRLVSSHD